jgi:hypothetical protein
VRALANVYLLSRPAARAFHAGRIPGVVVTDELLELAERHGAGADKGSAFFLDLAAKQLAVARGLGFNGAYLGGHATAETFGQILDGAAAYAGEDWRELSRALRFGRPVFEPQGPLHEPARSFYGEEEEMLSTPVVVKDNALARTGAWANDLLGRDHHAKSGQFSG